MKQKKNDRNDERNTQFKILFGDFSTSLTIINNYAESNKDIQHLNNAQTKYT